MLIFHSGVNYKNPIIKNESYESISDFIAYCLYWCYLSSKNLPLINLVLELLFHKIIYRITKQPYTNEKDKTT